MSQHGAKRQRLTGSFSPASPPYHVAAKSSETKPPFVQPNTPTSPPYPPMSSQSNGGPAMTATQAPAEMTPPASAHMSQQHASQPAHSATNVHPFPTPASTAAGSKSMNLDSDGDAQMGETRGVDAVRFGGHRLTNHNRQDEVNLAEQARAAAKGVCGSQLFKLCQNSHEPSRPHASQNLFALYGLNPLAKTVARNDPVTGEKINKLRKSYEGHIKVLQIAGKPKAAKMQDKFTTLYNHPDEDYYLSCVQGKEMTNALNPSQTGLSAAFADLLDGALAGMGPGSLPTQESNKYRAYLGTDDTAKSKAPQEGAPHRVVPSASGTPNPYPSSAASRLSRPERTGAKRQYTDSSFHGYGEGYTDDFAESTGGEDNGSMTAKRRKLANFERTSHQVEVGGARR